MKQCIIDSSTHFVWRRESCEPSGVPLRRLFRRYRKSGAPLARLTDQRVSCTIRPMVVLSRLRPTAKQLQGSIIRLSVHDRKGNDECPFPVTLVLYNRRREYFLCGRRRPPSWRKAQLKAVKAMFADNHGELRGHVAPKSLMTIRWQRHAESMSPAIRLSYLAA